MKKRLSVLLALTLTVSILCTGLAGCGKSGTQEKNGDGLWRRQNHDCRSLR